MHRVSRFRRHLCSSSGGPLVQLREVVLDDTAAAWEAAGFSVDPAGRIQFGTDLTVRLVGRAGGGARRGLVGVVLERYG